MLNLILLPSLDLKLMITTWGTEVMSIGSGGLGGAVDRESAWVVLVASLGQEEVKYAVVT